MNDHEAHLSQIMHEAAVAMEHARERIYELNQRIERLELELHQTRESLGLTRERLRRMTEGEL